MKYYMVQKLSELVGLLERGEPIPPKLLQECKEYVKRERKILVDRSEVSHQNLEAWKYKL